MSATFVADPGHAERARLHAVDAARYCEDALRAASRAISAAGTGDHALARALAEHAVSCANVAAGDWHSAARYGGLKCKAAMDAKWAADSADKAACAAANATVSMGGI